MDHACQQLIIDNHKWMHSSLPSMGLLPCIFGNILDQLVGGGHGHTGDFVQKSESVEVQGLTSKQQCSTHGRECSLQEPVQIDVSGLPCPDNSRANRKRKYEEGPSGLVYITWAQRHKMNQTPLLLIENVPDINMKAMNHLLGHDYILIQLFVSPSDTGHTGVNRPRTYIFCSHKKTCRYLYCIHEAYKQVVAMLTSHISTSPRDYLTSSPLQQRLECERVARARGVPYQPETRPDLYAIRLFTAVAVLLCGCTILFGWYAQGSERLVLLVDFGGEAKVG
ncbi:unnamed protein product [Symbiodinium necroappetens]|uniref:Uncharacterized protein n=1 Tax=Symbiodinium necroappetens TaxID=1628268 RepID=A0A812L981_9DINO|nr:unnamed protein product [Symbiodinium necroappetens]